MITDFIEALALRRSRYQLGDHSPLSDDKIIRLVRQCVQYVPSAFNSQSARVIVLLGQQHKQLWEITRQTLKAIVPDDKFQLTEDKIASFEAAYGSILYFEDTTVVKSLQEQFPAYQDKFPLWSQQSNGMLQLAVWTALAQVEIGATLQHYNPLIDDKVHAAFKVPATWELIAEMPFGTPTAPPQEKETLPLEDRVLVLS